jgi:hypothetical protein
LQPCKLHHRSRAPRLPAGRSGFAVTFESCPICHQASNWSFSLLKNENNVSFLPNRPSAFASGGLLNKRRKDGQVERLPDQFRLKTLGYFYARRISVPAAAAPKIFSSRLRAKAIASVSSAATYDSAVESEVLRPEPDTIYGRPRSDCVAPKRVDASRLALGVLDRVDVFMAVR